MDSENLNNGLNNKKLTWVYAIAVVVIVLVVFFVYNAFKTNPNGEDLLNSLTPSVSQEEDIVSLENQGSSDDVANIENDLNSTNLNSLDGDLQNIDEALK